jgi:hypothetical protein
LISVEVWRRRCAGCRFGLANRHSLLQADAKEAKTGAGKMPGQRYFDAAGKGVSAKARRDYETSFLPSIVMQSECISALTVAIMQNIYGGKTSGKKYGDRARIHF